MSGDSDCLFPKRGDNQLIPRLKQITALEQHLAFKRFLTHLNGTMYIDFVLNVTSTFVATFFGWTFYRFYYFGTEPASSNFHYLRKQP